MADFETKEKHQESIRSEARFLAGRRSRLEEFGRLLKIGWEFFRGLWRLHDIGPAITVFGSARFGETHPVYAQARDIGARLARDGYTVITGGGPGAM